MKILGTFTGIAFCLGLAACGTASEQGPAGQPGTSCSVKTNADGTGTIVCSDGTSFNIINGKDGAPGQPGTTGDAGSDGQPGLSCYVSINEDGSGTVFCPADGSSYTIIKPNGMPNGEGYNYCRHGYFGPECKPCTCKHGICKDGPQGDGTCESCTDNYWGPNCESDTITCVDGTPSIGVNGDGTCSSCNNDTDEFGRSKANYWGPNCDSDTITCVHGRASIDINGNGKCASCFGGYSGENCDQCPLGLEEGTTGTLLDNRDNKSYRTVVLSCQVWMAENIKSTIGNDKSSLTCYANTEADSNFVKKYGCLYTWADALKVCPTGWHLPTYNELYYIRLTDSICKLRKTSEYRDKNWDNSSNSSGFSALPAGDGYYKNNIFIYSFFGEVAFFWSNETFSSDSGQAYEWVVNKQSSTFSHTSKTTAQSVRCVKD